MRTSHWLNVNFISQKHHIRDVCI